MFAVLASTATRYAVTTFVSTSCSVLVSTVAGYRLTPMVFSLNFRARRLAHKFSFFLLVTAKFPVLFGCSACPFYLRPLISPHASLRCRVRTLRQALTTLHAPHQQSYLLYLWLLGLWRDRQIRVAHNLFALGTRFCLLGCLRHGVATQSILCRCCWSCTLPHTLPHQQSYLLYLWLLGLWRDR